MQKKLAVVDLDGTLLDSVQGLSDKFAVRLNKLIYKGLDITIATGRDFEKTQVSISNININNPIILTNGALIADYPSGKVMDYLTLPHKEALEILEIGNRLDLDVMVIAFFIEKDKESRFIKGEWWDIEKITHMKRDSYEGLIDNPIISIQYCNKKADLIPLIEKTERRFFKALHVHCYDDAFLQGYSWLEFNHSKAKKEIMLQRLLDLKGYDMGDVIYFGDQGNDIGALKVAGTSCVVKNAPQMVKKYADHVIPSNVDGGVIEFLEENFDKFVSTD